MAKNNKTSLKPDNTILVDYKKAHNDDKVELSQIDGKISDAEQELLDLTTSYTSQRQVLKNKISDLEEKKFKLLDRVAKNTEILGDE